MAENASFVQDGLERVSSVYRDASETVDQRVQWIQKEIGTRRKSLQKQLATGRKQIEKEVSSRRKQIEKRTRKQIGELKRGPIVKQARELSSEATGRLEEGVGTVLGFFGIASKTDVTRLDRKLNQINKKLRDLEGPKSAKRRTNGSAEN